MLYERKKNICCTWQTSWGSCHDIQTSLPILLIQYIFGINHEENPGQENATINGCDQFKRKNHNYAHNIGI